MQPPGKINFLRKIKLNTRKKVSLNLFGNYKTAFKGNGIVFKELREYFPGDDVRKIDWKASVKTNKLFIKSFEEERILSVMLAIDVSPSVRTSLFSGASASTVIDQFVQIIIKLCQYSGDKIGLCTFTDKIENYIEPTFSSNAINSIIKTLKKKVEVNNNSKTDIGKFASELTRKLRKKSIVFILSDFHSPSFAKALPLLTKKHDVIGVVLKESTDNLPTFGIFEIKDSETGEEYYFNFSSKSSVRELLKRQQKRLEEVKRTFASEKADCIFISNSDYLTPFLDLMRKRALGVQR